MTTTTSETTAELSVDDLVALTPDTRDRAVDFLRAFNIVVVVLWHWVFSVTHWSPVGRLTMPNLIGDVPAIWFLTWVLQIMPLFFFVGGFANAVAWRANGRKGGTTAQFLTTRLRRLLRPIGVFVGAWVAFELLVNLAMPGYRGALHWGFVVFVPLWFLGVYTAVVVLAPVTMRLHERAPGSTLLGLGAVVALVDVVRLASGVDAVGFANVLFVFAFVHQLGYWYGDGTLVRCARRVHWAMVLGAIAALLLLTLCGPYPISMVTIDAEAGSNMLPTTACISVLGVLQGGLALLLRPALNRWLTRRSAWKGVVVVNSVAMTIFTWHMTAYVLAVGVAKVVGVTLLDEPTTQWWLERPLWLLLPGAMLLLLIRVFAPFEQRRPA